MRRERWESLTPEEQEGFVPLCPDAVFEVRLASQRIAELREKTHVYLKGGASLAVLIAPYQRAVEVYRPGREPERHEQPERVALDPELPSFVLELGAVFEG